MQLGMIGLGRMGANMARRLMRGGHRCVGFDRSAAAVEALAKEGATGSASLADLVATLLAPRTVWLMIPAEAVAGAIDALLPLLQRGDTIVDGGNSHYQDGLARASRLGGLGLDWLDVGVSGGVAGLERGYCLMIGGEAEVVRRHEPLFATLAPGKGGLAPTPGRAELGGTAELGYLHCGPAGAGHFVKMIHNGIEYGLMAAYAEGLNILKKANLGKATEEGAPLRHPEHYRYDFDLGAITELWRRGSVISSWLLDLAAAALVTQPELERCAGRVPDSGEGRWALAAANDEAVPAHVLAAALFARFASRGADDFQNRVLSAMRSGFGGHAG